MNIHPSQAPRSVPAIQAFPEQLYVVTCVFNPRRFASRYTLYRAFEKMVADGGAKLLTVEVAFGVRPFEVTTSADPWNIQLRTSHELWHKERALNIAIQRLTQMVPSARYIAWIDADVSFSRTDWAQETMHALQHCSFVQMFGDAVMLGPQSQHLWACPSNFRSFADYAAANDAANFPSAAYSSSGAPQGSVNGAKKAISPVAGHPGLAWAATREALDAVGGLIDVCVAGSGDTHMANCLKGNWQWGSHVHPTLDKFSPGMKTYIQRWAERCDQSIKGRIGYVPGVCMHHWHGKSEQRGYFSRWSVVEQFGFDPFTDLKQDVQGLWQFAGNKPKMEQALIRSLSARNEDSVDVS